MLSSDAKEIRNTAKAKYLVLSKETGQVLGYALLLPGVMVKDGDVQLFPWGDSEVDVLPPDLIPGNHESHDNAWYGVRIGKVEGEIIDVSSDHGNKEKVDRNIVVKDESESSRGHIIIECVDEAQVSQLPTEGVCVPALQVGDVVFAKWDEDETWYNAIVTRINLNEGKAAEVLFIDYGNRAKVENAHIVKSRAEVPMDDYVDENVTAVVAVENNVGEGKELVKDILKGPEGDCLKVETPLYDVLDENDAKVISHSKNELPLTSFILSVGSTVVAKWSEDEVWYNAKVQSINNEVYEVLFIDYGNSAHVKLEHVLKSALDIPTTDCIDEYVEINVEDSQPVVLDASSQWSNGSVCIAQWSEDNIWYNAVVESMLDTRDYKVTFTDYGNSAIVAPEKIVATAGDVPTEDVEFIDENVKVDIKEVNDPQHKSKVIDVDDPPIPACIDDPVTVKEVDDSNSSISELSSGSVCFVCWPEDNVWYNAVIEKRESNGMFLVTFMDYGNQDTVTPDKIILKVDDIPPDQQDMVDENVELPKIFNHNDSQTQVECRSAAAVSISVGLSVIARWNEDSVWYNATVDKIADGGLIEVTFTDYGNTASVSREDIVEHVDDIPKDQVSNVDEYVKMGFTANKEINDNNSDTKLMVIAETQAQSAEIAIKPQYPTGSRIIARWSEDEVWYNAVVEENDIVTGMVDVVFPDYGNTAKVSVVDIVLSAEELPADQIDMIDECVILPSQNLHEVKGGGDVKEAVSNVKVDFNESLIGNKVVARWSEDSVWYNAVVDSVDCSVNKATVTFTDYGNSDAVSIDYIVNDVHEVPVSELDMLDQFVQHILDSTPLSTGLDTIREENECVSTEEETRSHSPPAAIHWVAGDLCKARWDEDEIWYNAEVLESRGSIFVVKFIDYGNEAEVRLGSIVQSVDEIPEEDTIDECVVVDKTENVDENLNYKEVVGDNKIPIPLQCSLCGDLCRKGMRLVCSTAATCWGCAVKKINFSRECWECGEKEIKTVTHLEQDRVLRAFVEQFVKTGKLDPAHVQALNNARLQASEKVCEVKIAAPISDNEGNEPKLKTEYSASPVKNIQVGTTCIARWSEDDVWYNAVVEEVMERSIKVNFIDYGNSDEVKLAFIVKHPGSLPYGAEVDPHVKVLVDTRPATPSENSKEFLEMVHVGADGVNQLAANPIMAIDDLKGPVGLAVLADKTLVVACKGDDSVKRFSMAGKFLNLIVGPRRFVRPVDVLALKNGSFAVRDELGIQMFEETGNFIRNLGSGFINRYYGLAEDDLGRVVTLNCNTPMAGGRGKLTGEGETDVFYIDTTTGSVVKRVELIDIVGEDKAKSACRFVACSAGKLYIMDMGLDCIYVLYQKDGEEQAEVFGSTGSDAGKFRGPAGLIVDSAETIIVVDSKNNRLQMVDREYKFCGFVQVDTCFTRPSGIFWYPQDRLIFVSNYGQQSVVCYQI